MPSRLPFLIALASGIGARLQNAAAFTVAAFFKSSLARDLRSKFARVWRESCQKGPTRVWPNSREILARPPTNLGSACRLASGLFLCFGATVSPLRATNPEGPQNMVCPNIPCLRIEEDRRPYFSLARRFKVVDFPSSPKGMLTG